MAMLATMKNTPVTISARADAITSVASTADGGAGAGSFFCSTQGNASAVTCDSAFSRHCLTPSEGPSDGWQKSPENAGDSREAGQRLLGDSDRGHAPLSATEQPGQPESLPSIGTVIRCLRVHRRMSLRELAKKAGLSEIAISKIERDVRRPEGYELQLIRVVLGLGKTATDLLRERPRAVASLIEILSIVRATQASMADGQERLGDLVAEGRR